MSSDDEGEKTMDTGGNDDALGAKVESYSSSETPSSTGSDRQTKKKSSRRFTFEMVQTALHKKQKQKERNELILDGEDTSYRDVGMNRSLLRPSVSIRDPTRFGSDKGSSTGEAKHWLRPYWLGGGLFLALYAFWILDSLKDPLMGALVNGNLEKHQPTAKLFSVCTNLVLVILLEYISNEQKKRQQRNNERQYRCDDDDDDEILNGGGRWSQMNVEIGYDKDIDTNDRSLPNNDNNADRVSSSMFAYIGVPYCLFFLFAAFLLQYNPSVLLMISSDNNLSSSTSFEYQVTESSISTMKRDVKTAWHVVGYVIYAAIESFGSLIVATFWSYVNTTLSLEDAMSYYGLIIGIAQLGAIFGSTMVSIKVWDNLTLVVVSALMIVLHIVTMITYDNKFPPYPSSKTNDDIDDSSSDNEHSVVDYSDEQEEDNDDDDEYCDDDDDKDYEGEKYNGFHEQKQVASGSSSKKGPTLWSGLYLILRYNYVLYILGASCLYEISLTCLNYQMTLLGYEKFEQEGHKKMTFTQFMGHYGQMVNISSLIMSSLIFPFLIKKFGLKLTIRLFPTLLLIVNIIAFGALPGNLPVLFFSVSILKALTYSIHDPSKEILYLPTTDPIKFKCKFWIDVMGARLAKAIGSSINTYAGNVARSIRVASTPSLLTSIGLWIVCYRVGQQFDYFVKNDIIVGSSTFNKDKHKYMALASSSGHDYDDYSESEEHIHQSDRKQKDDDPAVIELT